MSVHTTIRPPRGLLVTIVAFVALCVTVASGAADEVDDALLSAARDGRRAGDAFRFVVEQNGRALVPGIGGTLDLEAAPFVIWVVFLGVPDVLVNVSTGTDLYSAITEAEDVAQALGEDLEMVMGMAESLYNLDRSLFVLPLGAHYLSNPADGEHRFSRAVWHEEYVAGGRDVEGLIVMSRGGDRFSIDSAPVRRLYVSGLHAPWGPGYTRTIEDSLAFTIEF